MNASQSSVFAVTSGPVDASGIQQHIGGYGSTFGGALSEVPDVTTEAYAACQESGNADKTVRYLLPLAQKMEASRILDVGCGVGAMVRTFLDAGYDAYGVDLPGLHKHWRRLDMPSDRMFIVDSGHLHLPFSDGSFDFIYTLGVIEHVGTSDGHSDRLPDYQLRRRQWLNELFRVLRPGGAMLIAGPNRKFPVDAAHDLDSKASGIERWLSRIAKISIHKTWGENFLWSYDDVRQHLRDQPFQLEALPVAGFLGCSRVPRVVRPLVQAYVDHLPGRLLESAFNPWVMAMVHKRPVPIE